MPFVTRMVDGLIMLPDAKIPEPYMRLTAKPYFNPMLAFVKG